MIAQDSYSAKLTDASSDINTANAVPHLVEESDTPSLIRWRVVSGFGMRPQKRPFPGQPELDLNFMPLPVVGWGLGAIGEDILGSQFGAYAAGDRRKFNGVFQHVRSTTGGLGDLRQ